MINLINHVITKVNETTYQSDIAYLPSGFGTVRSYLKSLQKQKNKWKIEILEDGSTYVLKIEDKINISVPKKYWINFNKELDSYGLVTTKDLELDLAGLNEGREEESIALTVSDIEIQLRKNLNSYPMIDIKKDIDSWIKINGIKNYLNKEDILINYSSENSSIKNIIDDLKKMYSNDRGELELILSSLGNKKSLTSFDYFKDYDYLYGAIILSNPNRINMKLSFLVDFQFNITEQLETKDRDLLELLREDKDLKVNIKQGLVVPNKEKRFNERFFNTINLITKDI